MAILRWSVESLRVSSILGARTSTPFTGGDSGSWPPPQRSLAAAPECQASLEKPQSGEIVDELPIGGTRKVRERGLGALYGRGSLLPDPNRWVCRR